MVAATELGCAANPPTPRSEAPVRELVPVPICLRPLPRRPSPGAQLSLQPAEYWPLLWPDFAPGSVTLDPRSRDCTGNRPLASRGRSLGDGAALLDIAEADTVVGHAVDGFELVWLPSRADEDPSTGLLALLRARDDRVEVYALGVHGGALGETRFALERLGARFLVVAVEARCAKETPQAPCESSARFYLLQRGALTPTVSAPLERNLLRRGPKGAELRYHFEATLDYGSDGVHLAEHLTIVDSTRGELSRSDLERVLLLKDGHLVASTESLWQRTLRELGESGS